MPGVFDGKGFWALPTKTVTVSPADSVAPAGGSDLYTRPGGVCPSGGVSCVLHRRFIALSWLQAARGLEPRSSGTVTFEVPEDTTTVIFEPSETLLPADGSVLITVSLGTVSEDWVLRTTRNFADCNCCCAAAKGWPVTSGTSTFLTALPLETTRSILSPLVTSSPSPGLELMTEPLGTESLFSWETSPTSSPASVIAFLAASSLSPTTCGICRVAALAL